MEIALTAPKAHVDTTDVTKTQDICPEFPLTTTPEELHAEFLDLNNQIANKLAGIKAKTDEVEAAFEAMLPLYDQMQAMLSQRGPLRQMMDTAGMPSWTLWFSDHQKECPIAPSYKKVQRAIRARRGTVSPEPDFNALAKAYMRETAKRREKLERLLQNRNVLNPTIRKALIEDVKNDSSNSAKAHEQLASDFEELVSNGEAHQHLIQKRRAAQPDPLLDEKKALAANLQNATVREISREEAQPLILRNECLGSLGTARFFYGLYFGDHLGAAVCFGETAGSNVKRSVCGPAHASKVSTLVRGATEDWANQPVVSNGQQHSGSAASYLISWACEQMGAKGFNIIAAYSDPDKEEVGQIYSSVNFLYCGQAKSKHEIVQFPDGTQRDERFISSEAKTRGQTFAEYKNQLREQGCVFVKASAKHRWVGFFGDKRTKRALQRALKWKEVAERPKRQQVCDTTSVVTAAEPPQPARFDPSVSLQNSIVAEPWETNRQQVDSKVDGVELS
jgi:hypothetical protein